MVVESESKLFALIGQLVDEVRELRGRNDGATKDFYTIEEVAAMTGRAAYTIRHWVTSKKVHATRVSGTGPRGRLLIARDEIKKLVNAGRAASIPAAVAGNADPSATSGTLLHP